MAMYLSCYGNKETSLNGTFNCLPMQVDIPTTIGVGPSPVVAMETNKDPVPTPEKKHYIDPTFLYTPREGVEMASPLRDGIGKSVVTQSRSQATNTHP